MYVFILRDYLRFIKSKKFARRRSVGLSFLLENRRKRF